jgi:hypothetical protein
MLDTLGLKDGILEALSNPYKGKATKVVDEAAVRERMSRLAADYLKKHDPKGLAQIQAANARLAAEKLAAKEAKKQGGAIAVSAPAQPEPQPEPVVEAPPAFGAASDPKPQPNAPTSPVEALVLAGDAEQVTDSAGGHRAARGEGLAVERERLLPMGLRAHQLIESGDELITGGADPLVRQALLDEDLDGDLLRPQIDGGDAHLAKRGGSERGENIGPVIEQAGTPPGRGDVDGRAKVRVADDGLHAPHLTPQSSPSPARPHAPLLSPWEARARAVARVRSAAAPRGKPGSRIP